MDDKRLVVDTNNYRVVSPSGSVLLHSERLFCKDNVIIENEERYGFGILTTFSVDGDSPIYRVVAEDDNGRCKYLVLRFDKKLGDWVGCSLNSWRIRLLMRGTVSEGILARFMEGLTLRGYRAYVPIRKVYEPELLLWQRLAG